MPGFIGVPELLLLGLVVLLVFGPKRLPEMGRSLGRGMREFKDSVTGDHKPAAEKPVTAAALEPAQDEIVVPERTKAEIVVVPEPEKVA